MGSLSKKRTRDTAKDDAAADFSVPKKKRQYTEKDQKLAQVYNDLADERKEVRLQAAKDLVAEFTLEKEPSGEFIERNLARLIRGLCSSRKQARFGFSIALAELLRQFYCHEEALTNVPDLSKLVGKITELTEPDGSVAGQERKDHLFGRVFAYGALLQSSALLHSEVAKLEYWPEVLDNIYKLARTVPWLRQECGLMLCNFVNGLDVAGSANDDYAKEILLKLESHQLSKTPEGVAIWLSVQGKFPDLELPKGIWRKNDPLHAKERPVLMNAMRESNPIEPVSDDKSSNAKKAKMKTVWQQKPNFAWDVVLQEAIRKKPKASKFQQFWIEIVDNGLFAAKSSPERKFWGLAVFSKSLLTVPESLVPTLFSQNLMHCLIGQRADSERSLHEAATESLKAMKARIKKEPKLASAVITGLLTGNGSIAFDRLTKFKTVEDILAQAEDGSLVEILSILESLIRHPSVEDQKTADSHRQILADLILSTVKSHIKDQAAIAGLVGVDSWLTKALDVLALFAYFVPRDDAAADAVPQPPISEDVRKVFQSRLSSCLAHIFSKVEDASHWPLSVVLGIDSRSKTSKSYILAVQVDDLVSKSIQRAHAKLKTMGREKESTSPKQAAAMRAFKLLYAFTLLQVYGTDADAVSMLEDLHACYNLLRSGEKSQPFALLVELLLSFLSKPGTLYKRLAEQAFPAFTAEIDEETILSLLDILGKSESLTGQQEIFDQEESGGESAEEAEEESEEQEDDDEDEDEAASDVEMISAGSEDDDDDADESGDDEELRKFNAMLAETLKTSAPNGVASTNGATADDEETSDGEDMNDEQMMALEPHLTKIFKQQSALSNNTKKKEKKDAKETMIRFKLRVLDLLCIYVERECGNPLALTLLPPLLELIRTTSSQQVANRANDVMHKHIDACKKKKTTPSLPRSDDAVPAVVDAWTLLREVHLEVQKEGSKLHGAACSRASLFLANILGSSDKQDGSENLNGIIDIYASTQKTIPKRVNRPTFFTEWISWWTEARKQAASRAR